jgi:hypothetical protein
MAFVARAAELGVTVREYIGGEDLVPLAEVVLEAELAAEHEAAVQTVEPPTLGRAQAQLALGLQCRGDGDLAQVADGGPLEQFVEHGFIAAGLELGLDGGEVVMVVGVAVVERARVIG